jgi:hypothetical protein
MINMSIWAAKKIGENARKCKKEIDIDLLNCNLLFTIEFDQSK